MSPLLAALRGPVVAFALTGLALSSTGWAVAAANTTPATKSGDGAGAITGYVISNIVYTLNSTSPQNIDQVAFSTDIAPPAGATMKVKLVAAGATWFTCTNVGTAVTCLTAGATAVGSDQLRIVIAQ